MRRLFSGLRKDVWFFALLAIGLMSGISATFREWLSTFHPQAAAYSRVFQASLWTCFFLAMTALVIRQRAYIVGLEFRLDRSDATKNENKKLHDTFAALAREGEALADELRRGLRDYGLWLQKREQWRTRTSESMDKAGWLVDATDFRHAGEKDLKVAPGTVTNDKIFFELYRDQLSGNRNKLAEIVARRLPS
jgi:hypothetical protein